MRDFFYINSWITSYPRIITFVCRCINRQRGKETWTCKYDHNAEDISAYDIGDCIVFGAGDPNVINYGGGLLAVNKYDGTTSGFGVAENIDLLMDAKELDIPEKYKFKES